VKDLVVDHILSVGVDEIDDDHRKLVSLFNMLNHSIAEGDAPDYLQAVLEELISCTVWHFSHEERLMLKYGYEDIAEHKAEHQELIKSARELQQKILQAGKLVANEDIDFLERWLTGHILTADMRLGAYLAMEI
jgi:hemerythrin-like metal-binding protein